MTGRTARKAPAKARKAPAAAQPKRSAGRPSKYRPEFAEQATGLCLLGATNDELAKVFEVDGRTLDRWLASIPAFRDAVKAGREEADQQVARALYLKATGQWTQPAQKIVAKIELVPDPSAPNGFREVKSEHVVEYVEHFPPDTAAAFIWLKNRQPAKWRDKKEVHETRESNERVTVELSPRAQQHITDLKALLFRDDDQPSGQPAPNGAGNGKGVH